MTVEQLDRDDKVIKRYNFQNAWPMEVGDIQLGFDQNNVIETFNVTFMFDYWVDGGAAGAAGTIVPSL